MTDLLKILTNGMVF